MSPAEPVAVRTAVVSEHRLLKVEEDLRCGDDGTEAAALAVAELHRFRRDYYLNGCLQIWNAETGDLLGRKDAFIPENVRVMPEGFDAAIDEWRGKAAERAEAAASEMEQGPDG